MEQELKLITDGPEVLKLIERYKEQKGLNWSQLASVFDVSYTTLARWRKDPSNMPIVAFVDVAGAPAFSAMLHDGDWHGD